MEDDTTCSRAATRQHIELIRSKRVKLREAQRNSESQYLECLRRDHLSGKVSHQELYEEYIRYDLTEHFYSWHESDLPHWEDILKLAELQIQQLTEWSGCWPLPKKLDWQITARGDWISVNGGDIPTFEAATRRVLPSCDVVYVLFDADMEPIYVGSTSNLNRRMLAHAKTKSFYFWRAYRAETREKAYELEEKFLKQWMPPLNKKRSR